MKNKSEEIFSNIVAISIILFIIFFVGALFGWFKPAPGKIIMDIDYSLQFDDFYKNETRDGVPYITVQDKEYSITGDSHLVDNRGEITFKASNYQKHSSDTEWQMEITSESGETRTYERDTIPAGTETHLFSPSFSLFYGKNKVKVTAKNDKGTETFELVVVKLSVESECEKTENKDVSICSQVRTSKEADAKKAEEKAKEAEKKSTNNSTNNSTNSNKSNSSNSSSGSSVKKNSCVHYSDGKCWDELEDRAYDDGYRDAQNGGHAYYDPDCTGKCEDIYEDAYEEGYYDGKYGI